MLGVPFDIALPPENDAATGRFVKRVVQGGGFTLLGDD
jgi:hypothetical protein